MALNPKFSTASVNAKVDAQAALMNSGFMDIRDGTQPATANTAVTGTLLVTLTFGATAFGAGSGGVATANAITSGTAVATSTATWFRLFKSDHTTPVADGSVGTATSNLVLSTAAIVSGATVSISAFSLTEQLG